MNTWAASESNARLPDISEPPSSSNATAIVKTSATRSVNVVRAEGRSEFTGCRAAL